MTTSLLPFNRRVTEQDLDALIAAAVREDRRIEFKREYLPRTNATKFLRAVVGFANAQGGDIIMGIKEDNGIAVGYTPLSENDEDACRLQILHLIQAHVAPPLLVFVELVRLNCGGSVTVVRVSKSWSAPHMVDDGRFYVRHDGETKPMQFEEIRSAFVGAESVASRLRGFRSERCRELLQQTTFRSLISDTLLVLHVLPFSMLSHPYRFDVPFLAQKCGNMKAIDHRGGWGGCSIDLDGVITCRGSNDGKESSYVYVFRSGAIEAVDAGLLQSAREVNGDAIPYAITEPLIVEALSDYLETLAALEVSPPYAVFFSMLNARGFYMPSGGRRIAGTRISRDHLMIPETIVESVSAPAEGVLFPIFNSVWHACGLKRSANYDQSGNFKPH